MQNYLYYHDLAKPADDKGKIKAQGSLGIDFTDRYGLFLTGEYGLGDDDKEEYNVGLSVKVTF